MAFWPAESPGSIDITTQQAASASVLVWTCNVSHDLLFEHLVPSSGTIWGGSANEDVGLRWEITMGTDPWILPSFSCLCFLINKRWAISSITYPCCHSGPNTYRPNLWNLEPKQIPFPLSCSCQAWEQSVYSHFQVCVHTFASCSDLNGGKCAP